MNRQSTFPGNLQSVTIKEPFVDAYLYEGSRNNNEAYVLAKDPASTKTVYALIGDGNTEENPGTGIKVVPVHWAETHSGDAGTLSASQTDTDNAGEAQVVLTTSKQADHYHNVTATIKDKNGAESNANESPKINIVNVEITHIKFDHTAGDTSDGIDIRENNSTDITVPEWVKDGQNKPAAYKKSTNVTIKAKFSVSPGSVTSAKIKATTSDGILGNLGEQTVSFSNGVSDYVSFTPTNSTPSSVDKDTVTWQWKVSDVNGSGSSEVDINSSGAHTIYTLLGTPQSPMTEPWTEVLDYACVWANDKASESAAVTPITTNAYNNLGKNYDGTGTHTSGKTFNLTSFLSANWADCQDMSATVNVFTRAIGGTTTNVRKIDGPFNYKSIDPVGSPGWDTDAWNFHQVGNYSGVYDACLRLNQSNPRIPTGENVNGSYKTDLYDSGTWDPKAPFSYTTVN